MTIDHQTFAERREKLMAGRDAPGGYTKERLAEWGVPWPPPKGWSNQLIIHGWPYKPPDEKEKRGWFRVV